MRLVLASRSPARRSTLIHAGITPIVRISDIDEDAVLRQLPGGRAFSGGNTTPADEVSILAQEKCMAVVSILCHPQTDHAPENPEDLNDIPAHEKLLVVGCDSMLEIDGKMAGKPHAPDIARERIRHMRRTQATLWTGHHLALLSETRTNGHRDLIGYKTASASTLVHFGDISDAEIDAYVDSGEPLHVAGSFTIDGLGGPFITGVEGDHHSVVGISLPLLRSLANELGVFWPDLWDHRRQ
ncbi:Maf family protein [Schaalia sp. lx-260]|uniref:Maf family protein n=1 Tax=Schaalia sp. lx-260 TaxID=2899082 RepID=UPI001E2C1306|nr:Maf family protein [Schaalia sp. lx-260]MCD4549755.1 Maf family nucleotide pyrophosphatase [Schaalia sp. lx-260]